VEDVVEEDDGDVGDEEDIELDLIDWFVKIKIILTSTHITIIPAAIIVKYFTKLELISTIYIMCYKNINIFIIFYFYTNIMSHYNFPIFIS